MTKTIVVRTMSFNFKSNLRGLEWQEILVFGQHEPVFYERPMNIFFKLNKKPNSAINPSKRLSVKIY